jgi:hypothetical protein
MRGKKKMRKNPYRQYIHILSVLVICCFLFSTPLLGYTLQSAGPFDLYFYNAGEALEGYNGQQNWSSQQMTDVVDCVATWDNFITDTNARQIKVMLFWSEFETSSTLGSSTNMVSGDGATSWTYTEHAWRDSNAYGSGSPYDAVLQYDITAAGFSWNFGASNPSSGQIDFRSVITHEFGHSLGFRSTYNSVTDKWGKSTSGSVIGLSNWDKNLMDSLGNVPAVNSKGTPGNFNQTDNPVYFTGSEAVSYYGADVPIYAPTTYSSGSSLSHLDESTFSSYLMSPSITLGQANRQPSLLELEMMKDMDWSIEYRPGDSNLDWVVNMTDYNNLFANWGGMNKKWDQGDFNWDGTVDSFDLMILADNWDYSLGAFPIPEPSTIGFLCLSGFAFLFYQRKYRI